MEKKAEKNLQWLKNQVADFAAVRPKFETYAKLLESILKDASRKYAPLAIVQVRPKSIASFAEKVRRKMHKYNAPLQQITDLCGARIIAQTSDQVAAISRFIEENFLIDKENSVDNSQRLKPTEFGYRSIHYIVQFKSPTFVTPFNKYAIPKSLCSPSYRPRAEIQVRTLCEHAWADFSHDVFYKGQFKPPSDLEREFNSTAASLERIDKSFISLKDKLKTYASNFKSYMTDKEIMEEIEKLEFALQYNKNDLDMINRIGLLCIAAGAWDKAIKILSPYAKDGQQPVLRDLGIALCKKYKNNRNHAGYKRGQRYLEIASDTEYADVDAMCSYAGTFKGIDETKVWELYKRAFEADPTNPYAVGNYIEWEIHRRKDMTAVSMAKPMIEAALTTCRQQADANVNIPWAYYDMGKFHLLLNEPYKSLVCYARAVSMSSADFMIETSFDSFMRLESIREQITGFEWIKQFLLIALAARHPHEEMTIRKESVQLSAPKLVPLTKPVVVLAGGCDTGTDMLIHEHKKPLINSFSHFNGTVISGGTTAGICGLAGDIGEKHQGVIKTIGYVPASVPADITIDRNQKRYSEIRVVENEHDFSPLCFLQYWIDIVASGIDPRQVKLIGINGGRIAAAEYRVALALGAEVCILQNSGREADTIASDKDWQTKGRLSIIPYDSGIIDCLINKTESQLTSEEKETVAIAIHEAYRQERIKNLISIDEALLPWEHLPDGLKQSNLEQADHMFTKLERIGCEAVKLNGKSASLFSFTKGQIETMSIMEHGRWALERCREGWRFGEKKDLKQKISPSIIAWDELTEEMKDYDRHTVRKIPQFLAAADYEIRKRK
jgi:ppGpp synthetase/RelA/SpoT-type nucleotidyltranferase